MNMKKIIVPGAIGLATLTGIAGGALVTSSQSFADTQTSRNTSANTSETSQQTNTPNDQQQPLQQDWSKGGHQANSKTETILTGDDLSKAKSAAEGAVSGGTVLRAETDADGDGTYEVHMKKSDGSLVTVFLDENFKVTSTQDGMGKMGTPPQSNAPAASSTTTQNS